MSLRTPPGVLGRIVTRTAATLPGPPQQSRSAGPTRSLEAALRQDGLRLIAEVKPKSPSEGPLRDLDGAGLAALLAAYQPAAAISVLVDTPDFGGSFELLARVRQRVAQPVMAKGFFVDPVQLDHAHAAGADAVLLMASILPPESLAHMLAEAQKRGLDCLVEAHDDTELDEVLASGAPIVGVNARDLATLRIDLPTARARLARIPSDKVRVAESGLHTAADVDAVRGLADAVLIGTAFVKAADPAAALARLGLDVPR